MQIQKNLFKEWNDCCQELNLLSGLIERNFNYDSTTKERLLLQISDTENRYKKIKNKLDAVMNKMLVCVRMKAVSKDVELDAIIEGEVNEKEII